MAPNSDQRYDPVPPIPTYEEAVAAGSSAWHDRRTHHPHDVDDHQSAESSEGHRLLSSRHAFDGSSTPAPQAAAGGRRPRGYRPPTVETDDESSLFSSNDSDSDDEREADQVRREMQELEIDDSDAHGGARSSWGKRIGFSLSLPQWRWRWRWRLPRLRTRAAAASEGGGGGGAGGSSNSSSGSSSSRSGGEGADGAAEQAQSGRIRWFALPKLGSAALFMLVGRTLAIMIVLGFLYLLFASDLFANMARRMGSQMFDPESVRIHVQSSVDPRRIRDHVRHFTRYAHVAGTAGDYALMEDTELLFREFGLEDVTRDVYHVYLNYPKAGGRAVEILGADDKPLWSAKLEEEDTGGETVGHQTYAFHGLSRSGDVRGPLVYANYGTREDFRALKKRGIKTKGAIALVRNRGSQGDQAFLKVKAAEMAGFAGCIIYSDPADEGFLKGETAPKGRFMPADGVQRGSVGLTNWVVGDVLTPGWGSKENMPRMKLDQTKGLVGIPSLPIAWRDAQVLLQHLKGSGRRVPEPWVGGVPDVGEWWTGDGSSPIVRLKNEQDEVEKQPIWNVYGRIVGIEQGEKKIIIGNHRDSWAFGAAEPHSGTAIMLEMARILGDLVARGWRPLRTIEFMSWDGKEYNLIGSTEFVEQNEEALRENAFAYINLDAAVTGNTFRAAGSPVFRRLLLQILNRVGDPHLNATLRELWDRRQADLDFLGAASDYVGFQDIVGTSSLDLRFAGDGLPAHSSYQTSEWVENVGDPGFVYHTLLGQVVGLLLLELADRPILPFDMPAYADDLPRWVDELGAWVASHAAADPAPFFSLRPLADAARRAADALRELVKWELTWENSVAGTRWEPSGLGRQRCEYNSRLARFESDLLDDAGVCFF